MWLVRGLYIGCICICKSVIANCCKCNCFDIYSLRLHLISGSAFLLLLLYLKIISVFLLLLCSCRVSMPAYWVYNVDLSTGVLNTVQFLRARVQCTCNASLTCIRLMIVLLFRRSLLVSCLSFLLIPVFDSSLLVILSP